MNLMFGNAALRDESSADLEVFALAEYRPDGVIESVLTDRYRQDSLVCCYVSPFDAIFDHFHSDRLDGDKVWELIRATERTRLAFYSSPEQQRGMSVHIAWGAHNGKLALSTRGKLFRTHWCQSSRHGSDAAKPKIDPAALELIDRTRQFMGFYAWREALDFEQKLLASDSKNVLPEVVSALVGAPTITLERGSIATQLAIFNAESREWHFVPRGIVDPVTQFE